MTFNDLLKETGIDAQTVMVLRHRPTEPQLRKVLPWLAAEKPAVFNAYQQNQGEKVEKAMQSAMYVASFIGMQSGKATYVGLYQLHGSKKMTSDECEQIPEIVELFGFGMTPFVGERRRPSVLWFDLQVTEFHKNWMGKLIVEWPGKELSWWRWADRNTFTIHAIREESVFDEAMPEWDELILTWGQLQVLPTSYKQRLKEWRGIYFIHDTSSGKGYVGSAGGTDNILGRWQNYAASGHGGNKHLKACDKTKFVFSILQRLSPDTPTDEVVRIENTWKERLHTRHPSGLNDN